MVPPSVSSRLTRGDKGRGLHSSPGCLGIDEGRGRGWGRAREGGWQLATTLAPGIHASTHHPYFYLVLSLANTSNHFEKRTEASEVGK